ncbi:MAG: hypothetical protein KDM64_16775, partial [Verrucomicrobiae bacterium]|nr:hypothetical protein [Verrucomicrobiae bacterium]
PCVMRWPGQLPEHTVLDGMVASIDLLPTFAALAKASLDPGRKLDGLDVWPYLSGKANASPRNELFYSPSVIRRGDWKLMLPGRYQEFFPAPKAMPEDGMVTYSEPQLYHLSTDPGERKSVHKAKENQAILEELKKRCLEYQEDLKAHSPPSEGAAPPEPARDGGVL